MMRRLQEQKPPPRLGRSTSTCQEHPDQARALPAEQAKGTLEAHLSLGWVLRPKRRCGGACLLQAQGDVTIRPGVSLHVSSRPDHVPFSMLGPCCQMPRPFTSLVWRG